MMMILDFVRCDRNDFAERLLVISKRCVSKDVLDHHHRSIDDHAEIQRTERQQIRRNVPQVEKNCGEQEREGNRDGDNQRASHVPEEQKQNKRHQQHAVGEIAQYRVRGVMHQFAAVKVRHELHAGWQQA